jgi:hypothetical protein
MMNIMNISKKMSKNQLAARKIVSISFLFYADVV